MNYEIMLARRLFDLTKKSCQIRGKNEYFAPQEVNSLIFHLSLTLIKSNMDI